METTQTVSLMVAFSAGLLSFISPCVLPLVPSYLAYITGLSLEELTQEGQDRQVRWTTIKNSTLFILGFSTVFILFGASATAAGQLLLTYQEIVRKVGGTLVVLFGLYILGILKLPFLMVEKRIHFRGKPGGDIGTFLVGVAFAAGWTPCVGPILGAILLYASTSDSISQGISLLTFYSLGLGLPLLVTALGLSAFLGQLKRIRPYMRAVSMTSGMFLILVGVMIFTNSFSTLTAILTRYGIGWYIGQ
ncbi:MAG: cytochrome c biogenesis protein CcdA [Nitrospira sp.]|nr:cytochrome c biogenesis protein CcdA [Nitrospira sp.]